MTVDLVGWIRRTATWCSGFISENAPQSSARLIAILTSVACSLVAIGALRFAFLHPDASGTVAALGGVITALGGLVAAALAVRKRTGDPET